MKLDDNDFKLFGLPQRFAHRSRRARRPLARAAGRGASRPLRSRGRGRAARGDAVGGARQRGLPAPEGPAHARRLPVRAARRADRCREQHRDAGRLPDAADGLARGARRGRQTRRPSRRWPTEVAADEQALLARAEPHARRARRRRRCGARQVQRADVRRALPRRHRAPARSARRTNKTTSTWPCCRSPNPAQSPDPHQRRIAVGIDLGTTHSLVAAVRHGVAECLPDARGPRDPAVGRALPRRAAGARSAPTRCAAAGRRPGEHHRLGQALHGPRAWPTSAGARSCPTDFVDQPGMVALADARRRQDAGRGLGRDPGHAAPARRGQLRRRVCSAR